MGKLLPKAANISIPVYASINQTITTPEFDPYDLDVKLKDKLNSAKSSKQRDTIRRAAVLLLFSDLFHLPNESKVE